MFANVIANRYAQAVMQSCPDLATIEKVEDYALIMGYGVMSTPALVIDEKVVVSGRVPKTSEVRELITANMA